MWDDECPTSTVSTAVLERCQTRISLTCTVHRLPSCVVAVALYFPASGFPTSHYQVYVTDPETLDTVRSFISAFFILINRPQEVWHIEFGYMHRVRRRVNGRST